MSTIDAFANKDLLMASTMEDRGDVKGAIKLYRRVARLGDPIAQTNLANLLDDFAKPRRPKEAIYWYKRAIRSGYYTAAFNLAMHYRNLNQQRWLVHWLKVAVRMGDPDAAKELRVVRARAGGRTARP